MIQIWVHLILISMSISVGVWAKNLPWDGDPTTKADYCLDKSYISAVGETKLNIDMERAEDWTYMTVDASCCCTQQILDLFKEDSEDMTKNRVNPAVDKLIEALRNQRIASDKKIEELVYLKYVNTLYSFYDKNGTKMKKEKLTMPADDEDGCIEVITFRKLTKDDLNRVGVYREGILKEIMGILHAWKKSVDMIAQKNMIKMVK